MRSKSKCEDNGFIKTSSLIVSGDRRYDIMDACSVRMLYWGHIKIRLMLNIKQDDLI